MLSPSIFKEKRHIIDGVFIVLFMAMLTLPLAFIDLSSNRVSVQENRMLAARPNLADMKNHPGTFIRGFDAWFKDSTGFRKQLLALYNVAGMNLQSGVMYKNGPVVYLIGEHGHHFWAGENGYLIQWFQGEPIISDEQLANMANKLEEIKVYLDKKDIQFVVMFCTMKESIYPEFYPKAVKRGPQPVQLDVITGYLQEHTSVDVFNIKQALLAEKDNYLLYPVSSGDLGHYTDIGAFFAYRELMKHINTYFPDIVPYDLNDIDIIYDIDGIPYVSLKEKNNYKRLDPSFFDDVELARPFTWENEAYETIKTNLPVILFLHDSYVGYINGVQERKFIKQFIAPQFGRVIFIYYQNMKHFEEYVAKYKPDLVVFESVEARLPEFAKLIAWQQFAAVPMNR